ncbi:MAG: MBOAT family O-acyltransferase [Bdellovibrionota bacterium]
MLLLYLTIIVDYLVGKALWKYENHRRTIFLASIFVNIGVLAVFKYSGRALSNANHVLDLVGVHWSFPVWEFSLPLGISFYTFLSLSYTIDVFRRKTAPESSLLNYSVFVTFFPHLIAGPILRANEFLPQVANPVETNIKPFFGINRIAIGLIKKVVIADWLAMLVEPVYDDPSSFSGLACLFATYCYAFQIYLDFSGYIDIAIGSASLLGYELPVNFNSPYLAGNITNFWRRWHISLSNWLRDYLYISLGGNRLGKMRTYINLMITMLLGGLWHGASWRFVIWGGIHGAFLAIHKLLKGEGMIEERVYVFSWKALATFQLVCFSWIFFRATSMEKACTIIRSIVLIPKELSSATVSPVYSVLILLSSPIMLWLYANATRWRRRLETFSPNSNRACLGYGVVTAVAVLVMAICSAPQISFIYFQF